MTFYFGKVQEHMNFETNIQFMQQVVIL